MKKKLNAKLRGRTAGLVRRPIEGAEWNHECDESYESEEVNSKATKETKKGEIEIWRGRAR